MPIHGSLFQDYAETTGTDPFTLQNKKMLKIAMQYGPVNARTGSMVAYQGDVKFTNTGSGGLNKMMKSKLTGEGVDIMMCEGSGELFVADQASEIQVFYIENDMVSVNGASVLAFSASIEWDIHRVNAGRGGDDGRWAVQREPPGHRLRRRHHQGRTRVPGRVGRPHVRGCRRRRAVDVGSVDGRPCGHRRAQVHASGRNG